MYSDHLAFIRNQLYNGIFSKEYLITLLEIKKLVGKNGNPYAGLIQLCIENALSDIDFEKFKDAAEEIDLIHNIPISRNFDSWNDNHFFTIELLGYIEKSYDKMRIKKVIKEMAKFC